MESVKTPRTRQLKILRKFAGLAKLGLKALESYVDDSENSYSTQSDDLTINGIPLVDTLTGDGGYTAGDLIFTKTVAGYSVARSIAPTVEAWTSPTIEGIYSPVAPEGFTLTVLAKASTNKVF